MATDATGTPTSPDNIPTYNVDVDAPSGLGFNAAMAAVQTALSARVSTPTGILAGEAMVWNGTAWVRSSVTPITANGIGSGIVKSPYRKTTAKQVINSIAETDLLNGEITIAGNVIGTSGVVRMTAWGDMSNNSGGAVALPRFKTKLGATTLLDTGAPGAAWTSNAARYGWRAVVEIANSASNAQWASLALEFGGIIVDNVAVVFTTGEGLYATVTDLAKAIGGGAGAVDTTVAQALQFTVTLATANASEDVTLKGAVLEIL